MADWEKLNKEFNAVLEGLTDEQWQDWLKNREANRAMRRLKLLIATESRYECTIYNTVSEHTVAEVKKMECGKCNCIEMEMLKQGTEQLKHGYPCLKDTFNDIDLRKS